jgi:hypothetical protein
MTAAPQRFRASLAVGGLAAFLLATSAAAQVATNAAVQQDTGVAAQQDTGAAAQQDTAGIRLTVDGSVGLSFDDNPSLDPGGSEAETSLTTRLTFGLISETQVQTLNLRLSGDYVLRNGGTDDPSEFLGPDIGLNYRREGADSDFVLAARRRESDVRGTFTVLADPTDPLSPSDLIVDEGNIIRTTASARMRFGIEGPFGFELGVAAFQSNYEDTTDPDLQDTERTEADIALRARLTPQIDGRLFAAISEEQTDDAEETDISTADVGIGLAYALDPVRTLDLSAGIARLETTETVGGSRTTDIDEGLTFGLSYVEARPRGAFSLSLEQELLTSGFLTSITVGQDMEMPLGSLNYELGVALTDDGDTAPVGLLAYTREGPNSTFSTDLTAAVVPDDNDPVSTVRIGVAYGQALTDLLAWSLIADFGYTRPLGDSVEPDRRAATFEASVTRELTRDWGLSAGYIGRFEQDEGADSAWSNGAFVEIGRNFSFRP